jgi:cell division protein FtsZ
MKKKRNHQQTNQSSQTDKDTPYQVNVRVFGVGGGGGNAISRMSEHLNLRAIELIAVNTDMQDLQKCAVRKRIHIGKNLTRGLGTGMNPELGRQAAEENRSEIVEAAKGADLVFITAGLGGGTGSGAAPIVAEIAKEAGALTVAIVTKPFTFEGTQRSRVAEEALMRLRERVDALIVVPNDRVFNVIKKDTPVVRAFEKIDEILRDAISGITELIAATGIVNVDFSDVRTIMKEAGASLIGVGIATGEKRALEAASLALNSPLLEFSVEGARGVLFGISGGRDLKMTEINDIAKAITATVDPSAKIIFGAYQDRKLKAGSLKVTLIATGFSGTVAKSSPELLNMTSLFGELETERSKDKEKEIEAKNVTTQPKEKEYKEFKEKPNPKEKDFRELMKKPVGAKEQPKEEKKEVRPVQPPTPVQNPKPAAASAMSDIWEIPAFLRKKRRDNP